MGNARRHTPPDLVFRLIYRSRHLSPAPDRGAALGDLVGAALSHGRRHRITGALLVADDVFVQVLEGEEDAVRSLYCRIELDPRHEAVTVLQSGMTERVFPCWSMATVSDDDGPDPTSTPAQHAVLDLMRGAARPG